MKKDETIDEIEIAYETKRCANLLMTKKIDPKGISASFCNWRKEFST